MIRNVFSAAVLTLFLLSGSAAPVLAQGGMAQPVANPDRPIQTVSVNPIGVMFGIFSAEYERVFSSNATIGVSGSYWSTGDVNPISYFSLDAKYRRYLSGTALEGFYLGGSAGVSAFTATETVPALTTGVEVGYGWLLGAEPQFTVGLGVGAKRLIPIGANTTDATLTYPTARLSVGYAF